jgi:hypothetical protein
MSLAIILLQGLVRLSRRALIARRHERIRTIENYLEKPTSTKVNQLADQQD